MSFNNNDPKFGLASGRDPVGARGGVMSLFAGEGDILTDSAPAKADFVQYELAALATDGSGVEKFIACTHTAAQAVIVHYPVTTGQQCPYYCGGYFNHEALVWPAGTALDTYVERKAFFTGTPIRVGHCV